ncbi:hypothetical protein QBC35DRAFT_128764 [Podospora australis]|uniref:Uncharacterized protein n=1 Tax=Podospora australis TaxID=1536484 RepID=A0AAN6WX22_9PEZI|nr:hypothetical protein QBC35DRAFT_128764 [Podospora australis]
MIFQFPPLLVGLGFVEKIQAMLVLNTFHHGLTFHGLGDMAVFGVSEAVTANFIPAFTNNWVRIKPSVLNVSSAMLTSLFSFTRDVNNFLFELGHPGSPKQVQNSFNVLFA